MKLLFALTLGLLITTSGHALLEDFNYFDKPEAAEFDIDPKASVFDKAVEDILLAIELDELEPVVDAVDALLAKEIDNAGPEFKGEIKLMLARRLRLAYLNDSAWDLYLSAIGDLRKVYAIDQENLIAPLYEVVHALVQNPMSPARARPLFDELKILTEQYFPETSNEWAMVLMLEADLVHVEFLSDVKGKGRWFRGFKRRGGFSAARNIFVKNGNFLMAGDAEFLHARIYSNMGQARVATREVHQALELYRRAGLPDGDVRLLRSHAYLAQLYYRVDNKAQASTHIDYVVKYQGLDASDEPIKLYVVNPQYPFLSALFKQSGWVHVSFVVETDGTVGSAKVMDSDPEGIFDAAALEAVRSWRYIPVSRDGKAVVKEKQILLSFRHPTSEDPELVVKPGPK